MSSANIGQAVAYSLLTVANLFSSLKISNLSMPEVVQSSGVATLDCEYTVHDDRFIVRWLLNGALVYEWRPHMEPTVQGPLLGHLDTAAAASDEFERRILRIVSPGPELSGDYTCVVRGDDGTEDRQTKSMQVFSPEHEFTLKTDHKADDVEINCIARGLYPQPQLVLELNREPLGQQSQRVWRNESLYDAVTSARLPLPLPATTRRGVVTCRLQLPTAGYTAMREMHLQLASEEVSQNKAVAESKSQPSLVLVGLLSMLWPVLSIQK